MFCVLLCSVVKGFKGFTKGKKRCKMSEIQRKNVS